MTYEFDRLIPALEAGEIDLIAAGLSVTPERALHVNFSQPYAESGVALATHLQSTQHVHRLEDLDDPAYTLAAVEGSVAVDVAERLLPRAKLREFPSVEAASAALLAGDVHGYLEDEPIPAFLALENPDDRRRAPRAAAAAKPSSVRDRQGRCGLLRILECVDYGPRGRHVVADDDELLVRIVTLETTS